MSQEGVLATSARRPLPGGRTGAAFLTVATVGLWACAPPDRPPLLPGPPPPGLLAALGSPEVRTVAVSPGISYYGLRTPREPWAIHLLRVDLGRCELGLRVVSAARQQGEAAGRARVSELLAGAGPGTVGGVNGDFFTPEGLTVGTEVLEGEVRRVRARPAFAWHPGHPPWMGMPRTEGDSVLVLGWRLPTEVADGATELVGGFPLLLAGGRKVGDLRVSELPSFAAARHPRTALGFDPAHNHLWVVVVDGRQPEHSDGMTLAELTVLLESLGATEAVNLDGGGSSIMVVEGVPVSRPSDAQGERRVANALAIVRDRAYCRAGV